MGDLENRLGPPVPERPVDDHETAPCRHQPRVDLEGAMITVARLQQSRHASTRHPPLLRLRGGEADVRINVVSVGVDGQGGSS